ncbi:hydroxymethylglutaryl-CoA lyase [Mumia flava]|uniref:Hydroxymethylglutaryl-CoA lyase n=1 Tax=Mumia flava TaxID=1348852 RepID=A0A0B2BPN9_9ACTN|nr:hydroxymethylglutaryl-CoA lyase [Mumia flava]PJJ57062.1 hydroxymethylglutaryl-CoA lyase [Mumia flava]
MNQQVEICEVSPRDGLQNESVVLSTEVKLELIRRAIVAGARRIEAVSFVNPKRVPQMADAEDVMAGVDRSLGVSYIGLVMNERGLDRALAAGVDEINAVVVATDTFCGRNQGMTTAEACDVAATLVDRAREAGIGTSITIAAAFGCPFEGDVSAERLDDVIARVVDAGADEIALADTIGVGVPAQVTERLGLLARRAGEGVARRLHLHDTRNTGVANAVAGVAAGVDVLDASIGGVGGCPFAPNATGNVATEDLVYTFDRSGITTGLDQAGLIESAGWLEEQIGRRLPSSLLRAGPFPG